MSENKIFTEEYNTREIRDDGNSFDTLRDKQDKLTDKIHTGIGASQQDIGNQEKVDAVTKLIKEERQTNEQIQKQLDDDKALEDITKQTANFG